MVKLLRIEVIHRRGFAHLVGGVDEGVLIAAVPTGQTPIKSVKAQKPSENSDQG